MTPMPASASGAVVGIIANPAAGKDIRRLVAQGRVVSNQEKANTVRRVLAGLDATGVELALLMPDRSGIAYGAIRDWRGTMQCALLDYEPTGWQIDSTRAAVMMRDAGAGCIVTIGGDGTNRVVAKGAGDVPIAPISTGTNNVFPKLIEGTLAGLAAGAVATDPEVRVRSCRRACKLDIFVNGELRDIALIDAALSSQSMVGSRAIWDITDLRQAWLTTATPMSIGISSIGARLKPIDMFEPKGLHITFAESDARDLHAKGDDDTSARNDTTPTTVRAPIAPGIISEVKVANWQEMHPGVAIAVPNPAGCTIALDGEREIELLQGDSAAVVLSGEGPVVAGFGEALGARSNPSCKLNPVTNA